MFRGPEDYYPNRAFQNKHLPWKARLEAFRNEAITNPMYMFNTVDRPETGVTLSNVRKKAAELKFKTPADLIKTFVSRGTWSLQDAVDSILLCDVDDDMEILMPFLERKYLMWCICNFIISSLCQPRQRVHLQELIAEADKKDLPYIYEQYGKIRATK